MHFHPEALSLLIECSPETIVVIGPKAWEAARGFAATRSVCSKRTAKISSTLPWRCVGAGQQHKILSAPRMAQVCGFNMDDFEPRDYLCALELDFDIESQLAAIRALLRLNKGAEQAVDEEIKELEEHARRLTGDANEWAVDEWVDTVHRSAYEGAAHSMAAVGMLAPLVETIFHQCFGRIGTRFFGTRLPTTVHLRWTTSGRELWDCHFVYTGKKWRKDLTNGVLQLAEALELVPNLPPTFEQTVSALFAYRNKMFHHGLEWPLEERESFSQCIRREGWPENWFSLATSGDKPWIFYLSEHYIEHCLEITEQVLDALGTFIGKELISWDAD
jgi:hypothetical protein